MAEEIRLSGGNVSIISPAEAVAQVPLLRPAYIAAAIVDQDAMDIDVDALHQGFLRGARAAGAILKTNSRASRIQRRNGIWLIETADGDISAPLLVNAAGAWADIVAERCGAHPVGMQALRRTAILVDPPANVDIRDWPAVIDVNEEFYFKPDAGKLLLSPADETPDVPGDAQPEELDIAIAVDRVQAALNIDVRRVSHSWAGQRTFAPDRVPVLGFDPAVAGFFWCAGQGGYGIQTAPAMGRLAASLLLQQDPPADLLREGLDVDAISPYRFSQSNRSKLTLDA
jgi:D-arginine dehydrogenase